MLAGANRVAKAIVAFAVPAAVALTDLASQWLGFSEDGFVDANEWLLLAIAVASALGVYFKRNSPPA